MARKPKHEEHENHERWLVSYADFITLLFAFFVVMYSVSSVNEGKYRVLSDAIVAAFQQSQKSLKPIQIGQSARSAQSATLEFKDTANPIKVPEGPLSHPSRANKHEGDNQEDEVDFSEFPMANERMLKEGDSSDDDQSAVDQQGLSEAQLRMIANEIEAAMQPLIDRDLISVKRTKRWIEVEINTDILFTSGSAKIQLQSIPVLEALSRILAAFPNDLRVEGFTDNVAIKSTVYPSNWELSAARAASVVRLFSVHGIEPERMAAIGYGEFRPLMSNETLEGQIKNRRVMVVITANRNMKRPKSEEEEKIAEPEDDIIDVETEIADAETDTRINSDFLRLDALIDSSGLHRTAPVSVDELLPLETTVPGSSLISPVWIPGVNIKDSLSAPLGLSSGGE
ncbi:MAG: flagellar motor protein MotD [Gammaproteobacteria bacterium]|nr:flagellar motor protein MotD [Gammaproteobacteria bacterium]